MLNHPYPHLHLHLSLAPNVTNNRDGFIRWYRGRYHIPVSVHPQREQQKYDNIKDTLKILAQPLRVTGQKQIIKNF